MNKDVAFEMGAKAAKAELYPDLLAKIAKSLRTIDYEECKVRDISAYFWNGYLQHTTSK